MSPKALAYLLQQSFYSGHSSHCKKNRTVLEVSDQLYCFKKLHVADPILVGPQAACMLVSKYKI